MLVPLYEIDASMQHSTRVQECEQLDWTSNISGDESDSSSFPQCIVPPRRPQGPTRKRCSCGAHGLAVACERVAMSTILQSGRLETQHQFTPIGRAALLHLIRATNIVKALARCSSLAASAM